MKVNLLSQHSGEQQSTSYATSSLGQVTINGIIGNTRNGVRIDSAIDPDSNNPVSNKTVAEALEKLRQELEVGQGQLVFISEDEELPATGDPNKLYVSIKNDCIYRWDGSAFVKIPEVGDDEPRSLTPTIDIGNFKRNVTYTGLPRDLLNQRCVSYVAATNAGGWAAPNNGGTFEIGATVNITGVKIGASRGTTEIVSISANDGSKDHTKAINSANSKLGDWIEDTVGFDPPVQVTANRSGFPWTVSYKAENGTDIATLHGSTASFKFMDYIYWGNAAEVKNSDEVLGLANKKFISSVSDIGGTGLGVVPKGQYFYIVAPESAGAPIIKTSIGPSAMVDEGTLQVTNSSGAERTFKVYRSANTDISLVDCSIIK